MRHLVVYNKLITNAKIKMEEQVFKFHQTSLKIKAIIQLYSIEVHEIRRFPSENGPSEIETF
jgi:hypothetical protein